LLITAFYYRLSKESGEGDRAAIEFTHKTFSEYLVATLIFDRFEQLITAFSAQDGLDEAIENWASLSRAGAHEPSLAAFCQNEAKLRYARFSNLNWDAALTLLRDHLVVTTSGKYGLETITQTQRAMNLCLFIWSCLNLERQRRTGSHFKLFEPLNQFGPLDLKRLQLPNALNFKTGSLTEPQLHHQTFLTQSLSALEFEAADLSQLSFSIGHMQSLNCRQSSFAMTHWSHVKISTSTFQKTVFQHAIFHGARWSDSDFSRFSRNVISRMLILFQPR